MSDFELRKTVAHEWYWTFQGNNNRTIAKSSESYHNRSDCLHSIALVKRDGPGATVFDMTGEQPKVVPSNEIV